MDSIKKGELLYESKEGIATIIINRPEKMNALDGALVDDLYDLMCQIDSDTSIRVVVLKGAGGRAFVAGADIAELHQMEDSFAFRNYFDHNVRLFNKMMRLSQPIIAAISGFAFGGGCALAMACDLVVATTKSKFGVQEINMGFVGNGTSLTNLAGKHKAAELTMLGGVISATEAHRILLVNQIVEPEALDETVSKLCAELCKKSPYALKMSKSIIYNAMDTGISAAGIYETDAATVCFDTKPCKTALDAFVNKS